MKNLIIFISITFSHQVLAQNGWYVDFGIGNAVNKKQDINIYQVNHDDILLKDVQFSSHGFQAPILYTIRIGKENIGLKNYWELEHIHHKLYIDDIQSINSKLTKFEITDGYNLFLINKVFEHTEIKHAMFRLGIGTIYTHPDIHFDDDQDGQTDRTNFERGNGVFPTIWKDGYHWGGYAIQASIAKQWKIKQFRIAAELKAYHGAANIPVDDGHVFVPTTSANASLVLGYSF
ncbi:hypothetical protein [Marinicellulosiphila megalodicopiae]|uniref:hypothetical protein n=1 Tax=Marinicellulosiphila megalodicopiae TaxID=2724896 RepID=UPI003BB02F58